MQMALNCLFLPGQKVVFLPFGWRLNEISYRLWLDLTFLVVVGIGQSLNGICWYDLWSSSTWSETCIYLHQASWIRCSVLRCATSRFWRQTRRCTGRTIKAWDIISLHLLWGFALIQRSIYHLKFSCFTLNKHKEIWSLHTAFNFAVFLYLSC